MNQIYAVCLNGKLTAILEVKKPDEASSKILEEASIHIG